MKGWKTKVGAIGLVLTGIGTVIGGIDFETFAVDSDKLTTGFGMIGAGLTAFGIGHKIEKAG